MLELKEVIKSREEAIKTLVTNDVLHFLDDSKYEEVLSHLKALNIEISTLSVDKILELINKDDISNFYIKKAIYSIDVKRRRVKASIIDAFNSIYWVLGISLSSKDEANILNGDIDTLKSFLSTKDPLDLSE